MAARGTLDCDIKMTEEIIDREQLLAAFNELGVEEVDEAVSFNN